MKIQYNPILKENAKKNRKAGNLVETLIWNVIKSRKIEGVQFTRQKPIMNYIVDFYSPKLKLAIEIDGSSHTDLDKDAKRQTEIEKLGVVFLRFNNTDVLSNLETVESTIRVKVLELLENTTTP